MVRPGTRLLSGVNVQVTKIDQLMTPYPTLSDKDSEDIGPKLRYIADGIDGLKALTDDVKSTINDVKTMVTPTRADPTHDLSGRSIAASGVEELVKSGLNGYSAIVVAVKATYNASATAGVRVRWLYSPDGTNYDSIEDAEAQGNYEDLTFTAGATRQRTVLVPIFAPYVKIQVVNLDATYAVTVDVWSTLMR